MREFLETLKTKRKLALRLGFLAADEAVYNLKPDVVKKLLNGSKGLSNLTESDFSLSMLQKGVDMKIGLDIASLAYKHQADQIVLVSGDSDFTPAAKLARQEGIDFILDPMGHPVNDFLLEHVDGVRSYHSRMAVDLMNEEC
ncbi:MAG: NYN domain-containing protein [Fibrobacter sp.]|nr:NYN domain-containing protein [Fibrobacter sp.]